MVVLYCLNTNEEGSGYEGELLDDQMEGLRRMNRSLGVGVSLDVDRCAVVLLLLDSLFCFFAPNWNAILIFGHLRRAVL